MKLVSELTENELDYWVGKVSGLNVKYQFDGVWIYPEISTSTDSGASSSTASRTRYIQSYQPSSCWMHTGDVIQQQRVRLHPVDTDSWMAEIDSSSRYGVAVHQNPMIAVCMCVVSSMYGEKVRKLDNMES